jgi:hypothetical protein
MSEELQGQPKYSGRTFWQADIMTGPGNILHYINITRINIRDFIGTAPEELRKVQDMDMTNKYVLPYVYSLFKTFEQIKYIKIRRVMNG